MKESHGKDPASHPDPESCVGGRKDAGEALTGAHAGQPSSCEIRPSGVPTPLSYAEGNTVGGVTGKPPSDPAQSETLRMRGNSSHGKREIPRVPAGGKAGRSEKVDDCTSGMHAHGKSDGCVVCAGQRLDPEGSSPSAARMRGGVSKGGSNASSAGEHDHGEPYAGTKSETTDTAKGMHLPSRSVRKDNQRAGCPPRGGIRKACGEVPGRNRGEPSP